jgi:hypothetical protein
VGNKKIKGKLCGAIESVAGIYEQNILNWIRIQLVIVETWKALKRALRT